MSRYDFQIEAVFRHRIVFTRDGFALDNPCVAEILREGGGRRALVCLEENVVDAWPNLAAEAAEYLCACGVASEEMLVLPGGEAVKNDEMLVRQMWAAIDAAGIDRHSYVLAIGGGAFLDAVGLAAATAHRGVRLLRFPTTTLAQDDSGVGVKCAINHFGKKNWVGAFAVPFAVVNDFRFLHTQPEDTRRAGLIEAVKVALVKDAAFFDWIENQVENLFALDEAALEACVERSALLHAEHIARGGDPFEMGSSRPLDFGHWAAHKLEAMTAMQVSHAEAVAVGMALDCCYAAAIGTLDEATCERILNVLRGLGMPLYHEAMERRGADGERMIYAGLNEFREHLGGKLTILLPKLPGAMVEVGELEFAVLDGCVERLSEMSAACCANS